jgi:D-alanine transaminase
MNRTVYVNGDWLPEAQAAISVFDRGFLFADAVYEVTAIGQGKLLDFAAHAARLKRSLDLLGIAMPMSEERLLALHRELARRNEMTDGLVYLQISRGVQDRSFLFPADLQPTVVMFTQSKNLFDNPKWASGISMQTAPDGRWAWRHAKTVQLLYASLAKVEATRQGYDDALLVEDGVVTESSSANFHIVAEDGSVVTRDLSNAILPGVTRRSILDLAHTAGLRTEQRPISVEELGRVAEAFITDSINFVMPVVRVDQQQIASGVPGPVATRLRDLYIDDRLAHGTTIAAEHVG